MSALSRHELAPALKLAFGLRLNVRQIQDEVARFYGIKSDYMRSPDGIGQREMRTARSRQVAMFFTRELTRLTYPEIGRRFGNRDHSTVIHAVHTVQRRAALDPYLEIELEVLRENLEPRDHNVLAIRALDRMEAA